MAEFKILKSQNIESSQRSGEARIEYELISGKLLPGDVFRIYETHHYTNHRITLLKEDHFITTPNLFYDGQYEGAILDTDNLKKSIKYGYGGAGKSLYTDEAIQAGINESENE